MNKLLSFFRCTGILCVCLFCACSEASNTSDQDALKIQYDYPAQVWTEGLMIGNGIQGAMIYGPVDSLLIQLNETSLWGGSPHRNDNPKALDALEEIRKTIFSGNLADANRLVQQRIISPTSHGMPFQTAGNFILSFPGHKENTNFHRELNISKAVADASYQVGDVTYSQEYFASFSNNVIVVKIDASKKSSLDMSILFDSPQKYEIANVTDNELLVTGVSSDCEGIEGKIKFATRLHLVNKGGRIAAGDGKIILSAANQAILYIVTATNYKDYATLEGNPSEKTSQLLAAALKVNYNKEKAAHIDKYSEQFNTVTLQLGDEDDNKPTTQNTDQRIKEFKETQDPSLVALYFQFGRYLLLSCSQPGGQPANLQGIWNAQLMPPWDSKYTININTEMNYWPALPTNMPQTQAPLFAMLKDLSVTGAQTAREMYGARGWLAHHNTDIWRTTGAVDGPLWGTWPMGGAWLSQQIWEDYLYRGDLESLRERYPILKDAATFFVDFLVRHPGNDWWVVVPSLSPENTPKGFASSLTAGTTMDNQLVYDLFTHTAEAAQVLGCDQAFADSLLAFLPEMPPMQIGNYGQLQEWLTDVDNPLDNHRHVSHLYGLYPSRQISPFRTPELAKAAKTVLIHRTDASTGWSMGWKVNLWARLLDGDHAFKLIQDQLTLVSDRREPRGSRRGPISMGGGTYANLFDAHPPFQIDGNFGCTAGIAQMMLQSQDGAVHVLPALPSAWPSGKVTGLCAQGSFEVEELTWKEGRIEEVTILSKQGGNLRIRSYWPLKGEDGLVLTRAEGVNTNPFFKVPEDIRYVNNGPQETEIGFEVPVVYDYDVMTTKGGRYRFEGE